MLIRIVSEKHGSVSISRKGDPDGDATDGSDQSNESSSEEEDDDGVLATEKLDSEMSRTLNALRSKDPSVYDPNVTFFSDDEKKDNVEPSQKIKPMFLRDYHRENLLRGPDDEDTEEPPKTFAMQQADLKNTVVKEMHEAVDKEEPSDDENDGDDFLIRKEEPLEKKPAVGLDIDNADKNPELYLSNFLASRAWVPTEKSKFQPFESDDDEEMDEAELFEEAYNLRFEDPNKVNERLVTHARDATSRFSVRREEPNSRKKRRDAEKAKKDEEHKNLEAERARLRKLKIEQMEEKTDKIKKTAGIKSSDITEDDWLRFLDEDWDNEKWEKEMNTRFGEDYYAQEEDGEESDNDGPTSKKRLRKPKWDDDIDVKDLDPDFDEGIVGLGGSDVEKENDGEDVEAGGSPAPKKKDLIKQKREKQREARRDHRKIEMLVDQSLNMDTKFLPRSSKKQPGFFRYRETSPVDFGLSSHDILLADDRQLNQFAGLKKLASFRDEERKKRDRKKLGKKARLRQWRKDTFGSEEGPTAENFHATLEKHSEQQKSADGAEIEGAGTTSKPKRKRSRKHGKGQV